MTKIIKTLIVAWIILTVVAVSLCLYLGFLKVKENIYQQGRADLLEDIKGGIRIGMNDEEGKYEGTILFIAAQ